ncbi:hypothetical protein K7432_012322 [Basidiobolus ranarum]|uniref:Uncharacterized protein n=1 Tax=Basidiobolus ranarum TaxID=34480 RepID=A0ABR2VTB5_9FUNG
MSSTCLDSATFTPSAVQLKNKEVLVDFFNTDVYPIPRLLLWKHTVGNCLEATEANYVHLNLNIDTQTQKVVNVSQLKDRRIVVVISDNQTQHTEIYLEYPSNLSSAIYQRSSKLNLNRIYNLVGLNFVQNILAIYSSVDKEVRIIV